MFVDIKAPLNKVAKISGAWELAQAPKPWDKSTWSFGATPNLLINTLSIVSEKEKLIFYEENMGKKQQETVPFRGLKGTNETNDLTFPSQDTISSLASP